jgi:hypothetical protein
MAGLAIVRAVAFPGPRRDGLGRVVGDDVELVDELHARVPALTGRVSG